MAAGHKIFPGRSTPARTRDDVVESQVARRQHFRTVLTGVPVAQKDVLARERTRLMRNATVFEQPYHRWHSKGKAGRMQEVPVLFFGHRYALKHQHNRA